MDTVGEFGPGWLEPQITHSGDAHLAQVPAARRLVECANSIQRYSTPGENCPRATVWNRAWRCLRIGRPVRVVQVSRMGRLPGARSVPWADRYGFSP